MIADLSHRISLCRQMDVVLSGAELSLAREEVITTWASITPKKGSTFSAPGMAIKDSRSVRTHIICIRYRPDLLVSTYAWIYEARRLSPPRWFKVLSVAEGKMHEYEFDCRLVERGDDITRPGTGPATELPLGVQL